MVVDTILVSASSAGSGGTAATVAPPGSLTLQPDATPRFAYLVHLGRTTAAHVRIISPSGHDSTLGFDHGGGYTTLEARVWTRFLPRVGRGETLAVTLYGSATSGHIDSAALGIVYNDVQGGEWISPGALDSQIENVTSGAASLAPTTNATWPTGTPLSTLHTQLHPQRRYAVLGADCGNSANILGVMITGPDTGWYRQLWPVGSQSRGTVASGDLIPRIAAEAGIGVPVITGGNASQTLVGLVGCDLATSRTTTIYLALLK